MQKPNEIDYAKLLGFQALSDQPSAIGAKVGQEAGDPSRNAPRD
jgi:hypothetical protein